MRKMREVQIKTSAEKKRIAEQVGTLSTKTPREAVYEDCIYLPDKSRSSGDSKERVKTICKYLIERA